MINYKFFKSDEIEEARRYYYGEAIKYSKTYQKRKAIHFLNYFDTYENILFTQKRERAAKGQGISVWLGHNLNRVEGMLERYFTLKEKGRL